LFSRLTPFHAKIGPAYDDPAILARSLLRKVVMARTKLKLLNSHDFINYGKEGQ
jgi:hypothetical protein